MASLEERCKRSYRLSLLACMTSVYCAASSSKQHDNYVMAASLVNTEYDPVSVGLALASVALVGVARLRLYGAQSKS